MLGKKTSGCRCRDKQTVEYNRDEGEKATLKLESGWERGRREALSTPVVINSIIVVIAWTDCFGIVCGCRVKRAVSMEGLKLFWVQGAK